MSEIDLIPADYARAQRVLRQLRMLGATLAALVCVVALARGTLGILLASEKEQVARLQEKKVLWQETKARTEKLTSEAQLAQKQLDALDDLRGREQLGRLLHAVDQAYVEKVWFDEIRYFRREQAARVAAGQKPPASPPMEQRAGMVGHALNHVTLAEFMRKMERQPAIAELALVDTSPRAYPSALVIDFKLALLLEQNTKAKP